MFYNNQALKTMAGQRSLTVVTGFVTAKKLSSTITMTVNTLTTTVNKLDSFAISSYKFFAILCNRPVKQSKSMTGTLHR